ncbi:MAG: exo-beta-N-acetylmuramidase NamZ domain-containing protein, partial [Sediminibacterium sp.]
MPLQFGVDIILKNEPNWKQERIAMLTNDAARTNTGINSRLALKNSGFNLSKIFSPEHGIKTIGEDGAKMHDGLDEITELPVISLYGDKYMPTADDLKDIDIMLFDVPDAGTRFYTYLWSMTYWIEAAAKLNKKVVILDRPNPLGGNQSMIEGPMLDHAISSFIGRLNIPVKHQCTLGELALYFNATQKWNTNIKVIACEGWKREHLFYDWLLQWINPSPALQNFEATLLYPGLCFFESTNVSVGRGTTYSFE